MKLKGIFLLLVSLTFSMSLVTLAFAQVPAPTNAGSVPPPTNGGSPIPTQSQAPNGQVFQVQNPLGPTYSLCQLVKNILNAVLQLGIPIAVLFIVYAGFKFVIARGNPGKLEEARRNALNVVIGIAIFLGAWLLSQVIINTVNALQSGSGNQISSC